MDEKFIYMLCVLTKADKIFLSHEKNRVFFPTHILNMYMFVYIYIYAWAHIYKNTNTYLASQ